MRGFTNTTQRTLGHGSGKLILFGEHAVVHGYPAIVAGLGTGATAAAHMGPKAKLTLTNGITGERLAEVFADDDRPLGRAYRALLDGFAIEDSVCVDVAVHLPIGAGLGSSAALAVATARALRALLDAPHDLVPQAVEKSEAVFHGNASGIDQAAALWGGLFRFVRPGKMDALVATPMRVLACQAAPGASTADMVTRVADRHRRQPLIVEGLFASIGAIVDEAEQALADGDLPRLGELMDMNHGVLHALGVSTEPLDDACHVAREAGAYGAKLTGAGGGGCAYALAPDDRVEDVIDAWRARGWSTFDFELEPPAVR